MKPVTWLKGNRVKIGILALRIAIIDGTLNAEDEATVERILPGLCAHTRQTVCSGRISAATRQHAARKEGDGKENHDPGGQAHRQDKAGGPQGRIRQNAPYRKEAGGANLTTRVKSS